ncbi:hypothetical protein AVEN_254601-1 [Araneus ventricosus]|uniref:Uncharacterized protein n=1 Tax=Araneus ventricosus TaxID=182803 RepID=A0A4Y2M0T9_ARAVE|nr:hypothetical protein AVEN_254601-1 [Araneus ventricosus]
MQHNRTLAVQQLQQMAPPIRGTGESDALKRRFSKSPNYYEDVKKDRTLIYAEPPKWSPPSDVQLVNGRLKRRLSAKSQYTKRNVKKEVASKQRRTDSHA